MIRKNDKHLRVPYYCAFERGTPGHHRATIWQYGGAIKGAHQPFVVVDIMECANEAQTRFCVEWNYPGIDYAPVPQVINGRLYP